MGEITADTAATPPAGFATWAGFAAMCLGMFMAVLDVQIVATSLPTIQKALDIPPDWMSWIQTAYLTAEVIAIPLTGLLTRTLSMRGLFLVATGIFTLSSIGCALSGSIGELLAWRIVQGFSGGMLIPLVFAAVFLLFPFKAQGVATTIAGVLAVLAPTIGPGAGGWVTEASSWHWLFLINVVPGIVACLVAAWGLPRQPADLSQVRHLDGIGLALLAVSLTALEIGLKEAPQRGWTSPIVLGLFAAFLGSGVAFCRRMLARAEPIVNIRLLRDRDFAIGCFLSFVTGAGIYGSVYLLVVFLAFVRGHTAIEIGLVLTVSGGSALISAPFATALERRVDARLLAGLGFLAFTIGIALASRDTRASDFNELLLPQIIRGSALLFCILPSTRLAIGHMALSQVPDASGLFNFQRNLGGALGLALIDTIIYGRSPGYGADLGARLMAGDASAAAEVGLPTAAFQGQPMPMPDQATLSVIQGMVEKAALVHATNDAWIVLAALTASALVLLPFVRHRGAPVALAVH